ncbi:sigma-70 family RNA polymerase sigma factor [Persicobacter diffluens]|uniref:RNA polymerase sigma factor 70 region 4 type 2 domain-containing protein n=1 Tax=Persicobacter diffluens TaxID=981 RepID=A0AAN4W4M5_9BACT|nr:hypothetical protein PEDI_47540 [Persicobacter diffluens]
MQAKQNHHLSYMTTPKHKDIYDSEIELWLLYRSGDKNALATLYSSYFDVLYQYGKKISSDKELVMDTIQDLFNTLIQKREQVCVPTSVKAYLITSFKRKLIRSKSKIHNTQSLEDKNIFVEKIINTKFLQEESIELYFPYENMIKNACEGLTQNQQKAIQLYFFENKSYQEIAQLMQMQNVKSARTIVYRALKNLNQRLKPFEEFII